MGSPGRPDLVEPYEFKGGLQGIGDTEHLLHHRVLPQYIDCTYNFLCVARRRNYILHQV